MRAAQPHAMFEAIADSQDQDAPAEATQPDPYDGVALGVECAWPTEIRG